MDLLLFHLVFTLCHTNYQNIEVSKIGKSLSQDIDI